MSQALLLDIDNRGVATVTLNRPEKHNAFDDGLINELSRTFAAIEANKDVRVMVLTSNGKNFCAGADLGWMQRMAGYSFEDNKRDAEALANMLHLLNTLSVPTIAKIKGAAFGGALGLIACCDIAIACKMSKFCLSEVKIGLTPATISPYVIRAMGERQARRYFLSAEVFEAARGVELGLLHEAVSEEDIDEQTERLINALLGNSPAAVSAAKDLIFAVSHKPIDAALRQDTSERIAAIRVSDQGQAGLNAFLNKRPAPWRSTSN